MVKLTPDFKRQEKIENPAKQIIRVKLHGTQMTDLPGQMHFVGQAIVQVGKCNPVLSSHWLSNNDLVNVIEFIPIFIMEVHISH